MVCGDALEWLQDHPALPGCSLVTSLPDLSEFSGIGFENWKSWFADTASLILSRCPDDGVVVFYQTDIRHCGLWVDKSYLIQKAAEAAHMPMLWHKVACRHEAGTVTPGRPGYSHILCFSRGVRPDLAQSSTDVMPFVGEKTWERGMGFEACRMVAKFISAQTSSHTVVQPFCGEGAMLAAANHAGLSAIGIERSPKRAERARLVGVSEKEAAFTGRAGAEDPSSRPC